MWWILLVLLYGLLKGGREIVKKKSLEKLRGLWHNTNEYVNQPGTSG